jgi:excisionase family DNA binding protein
MTSPEPPQWANPATAAKHLGVEPITLYRLAKRGTITAHRLGAKITRYDINELDRVLRDGADNTAVAAAIDTIRQRLTDDNPRTLISYARVHEVINDVAAQYGANQPDTQPATRT